MILCKTLRISVFLPCCFYLKCTILAKPTLKTFIIFAEDPWQYINIARGTTLIASLGNLKKKKNIGSDVKQQKMEMVELGGIVGASFYHSACPYPEMQKVGDTGDISLLSFLAGAIFWAILGNFGSFWVIFGPFLGANLFWPKMYLCHFYYFLHLCHQGAEEPADERDRCQLQRSQTITGNPVVFLVSTYNTYNYKKIHIIIHIIIKEYIKWYT